MELLDQSGLSKMPRAWATNYFDPFLLKQSLENVDNSFKSHRAAP